MFRSHSFWLCQRVISVVLIFSLLISPEFSYAQSAFVATLPAPGTMLGVSPSFVPVLVKGLVIHPDKPLNFDFIVDSGNDLTDQAVIKEQSERIAKYFLAAVTVPEDQLWVNLSPFEKDRIIANDLGKTILGRDMLAQDYVLKQLTASLIYPEEGLGKEFWARIYSEAQAKFGTTDIPVDTFNKVWIMPDKAEVFEKGNAVYVTQARLKVMLDVDRTASVGADLVSARVEATREMMRQIILPAIEKEVNEGKSFAAIRQVYHTAILAKWYRELIQNTLLSDAYVGKNFINGVAADEKAIKAQIYERYIDAYRKGVFNYIKEEPNAATGELVPRKYFSGGEEFNKIDLKHTENAQAVGTPVGKVFKVDMAMGEMPASNKYNAKRGGFWAHLVSPKKMILLHYYAYKRNTEKVVTFLIDPSISIVNEAKYIIVSNPEIFRHVLVKIWMKSRNNIVVAGLLADIGWVPNTLDGKIEFYQVTKNWEELAKLGDPAVPVLVKEWQSGIGGVGVARALYGLGWVPQRNNEKVVFYVAVEQWDKLIEMGAIDLPALVKRLRLCKSREDYNDFYETSKWLNEVGVKEGDFYFQWVERIPESHHWEYDPDNDPDIGIASASSNYGANAYTKLVIDPGIPGYWKKVQRSDAAMSQEMSLVLADNVPDAAMMNDVIQWVQENAWTIMGLTASLSVTAGMAQLLLTRTVKGNAIRSRYGNINAIVWLMGHGNGDMTVPYLNPTIVGDRKVQKVFGEMPGRIFTKLTPELIRGLRTRTGRYSSRSAKLLDAFGWAPKYLGDQVEFFVAAQRWDKLVDIGAPAVGALFSEGRWDDLVKVGAAAIPFLLQELQGRREAVALKILYRISELGYAQIIADQVASLMSKEKDRGKYNIYSDCLYALNDPRGDYVYIYYPDIGHWEGEVLKKISDSTPSMTGGGDLPVPIYERIAGDFVYTQHSHWEKKKRSDAAMGAEDIQATSSALAANVPDAAMMGDIVQWSVIANDISEFAKGHPYVTGAILAATVVMSRRWWLRNTVSGNIKRLKNGANDVALEWLILHADIDTLESLMAWCQSSSRYDEYNRISDVLWKKGNKKADSIFESETTEGAWYWDSYNDGDPYDGEYKREKIVEWKKVLRSDSAMFSWFSRSKHTDFELTDRAWKKSVLLVKLLGLAGNARGDVDLLRDKGLSWMRSSDPEKQVLGLNVLRYLFKAQHVPYSKTLLDELLVLFRETSSQAVRLASLDFLGAMSTNPNPLTLLSAGEQKKLISFRGDMMAKMQPSQRVYAATGVNKDIASETSGKPPSEAMRRIIAVIDNAQDEALALSANVPDAAMLNQAVLWFQNNVYKIVVLPYTMANWVKWWPGRYGFVPAGRGRMKTSFVMPWNRVHSFVPAGRGYYPTVSSKFKGQSIKSALQSNGLSDKVLVEENIQTTSSALTENVLDAAMMDEVVKLVLEHPFVSVLGVVTSTIVAVHKVRRWWRKYCPSAVAAELLIKENVSFEYWPYISYKNVRRVATFTAQNKEFLIQERSTVERVGHNYMGDNGSIMGAQNNFEYFSDDVTSRWIEVDVVKKDSAQNGGIDIQNINVAHKPGSVKIKFNNDALREVLKDGFNGFTPVILNITPVASPLIPLGVAMPGLNAAAGLSKVVERSDTLQAAREPEAVGV